MYIYILFSSFLLLEKGTKHYLNHIKFKISIVEILKGESIFQRMGRFIFKDIKRYKWKGYFAI
jgi:hypothetical protein